MHVVEGSGLDARNPGVATERLSRPNPFRGVQVVNNGYDRDSAERALASGHCDLISFGRLFIGNPDLVERLRRGGPFVEAPRAYWYGGTSSGYSDWPALPQE